MFSERLPESSLAEAIQQNICSSRRTPGSGQRPEEHNPIQQYMQPDSAAFQYQDVHLLGSVAEAGVCGCAAPAGQTPRR